MVYVSGSVPNRIANRCERMRDPTDVANSLVNEPDAGSVEPASGIRERSYE